MEASAQRSGAEGGGGRRRGHHALYKTEMCRTFTVTGDCRYGDKCQFAHGIGELRPVARHPKHKTERCRTFWTEGHCQYSSRCRFLHDEPSLPDDDMFDAMPDDMQDDPLAHVSPLIGQMLASAGGLGADHKARYMVLVEAGPAPGSEA